MRSCGPPQPGARFPASLLILILIEGRCDLVHADSGFVGAVSTLRCALRCIRAICANAARHLETMPRVSRRSFLDCFGRAGGTRCVRSRRPGLDRHRCRDRWRRSGRDCRRAPARRRRPKVRADRSCRPHRRPLRDRYAHVRRSIRSRRALDPCARYQSGNQVDGAARDRSVSCAGKPKGPDRQTLCARRRA